MTKNVNISMALQELGKEMLLWLENGDARDLRTEATATFFSQSAKDSSRSHRHFFRGRRGARCRIDFTSPEFRQNPFSASTVWGKLYEISIILKDLDIVIFSSGPGPDTGPENDMFCS